ncbi:restriction endonuclease subunit S [Campylobacter lari]|nr:restriction endonuclease subunit S [Campylobacter lari]
MNNWKKCKLGDIAEILNNKRIPLNTMQRQKMKGEYPYYGASGIIDYVNDYLFDGEYVLISEDGENLKSRKTPIAFKASGKFWVNNHAHIIKGKMDFQNDLIVYIFKNIDLNPYLTGAVQPKLNKENLLDIDFYLPPLEEQRQIAAILSSIDDKIELLHEQNKTLEKLAQTLFRHYFIENPNPSWQEKPLSDFGNIICGKTPSKNVDEYYNGDIPFIKIPDMHGNIFVFKTNECLSELGSQTQINKLIPKKSICVSCIATVGMVSMNAFESHTNQQINSIVPKKEHYRYFLYLYMKHLYDYLQSMASGGTATANLNTRDFSNIHILMPDEEMMINFNGKTSEYFDKIFKNLEQIQTLENMRDILIPKLLNGEIKINN